MTSPMPPVFRAYDIRGLAHKELTPAFFQKVGQAFGALVIKQTPETTVCVGHDTRDSSPAFYDALIKGLTSAGCHVITLGLSTTPLVCWAEQHLSCAAALTITGSHTDAQRNGLKISWGGRPFYGDDLQKLKHTLETESLPVTSLPATAKGTIQHKELHETYVKELLSAFDLPFGSHKIVWNFSHGAATCLVPFLKKLLPFQHTFLHTTPQAFPACSFDPTHAQAVQTLKDTLQKEQAVLGLAFDGDGDRLVVMDQTGTLLSGDEVLVFFATFQKEQTKPIVADIKSSPLLLEAIAQNRSVHIAPTGHAHLKACMRKTGASLGGEVSGHFFFKDRYFGFDDGFYASLRFLEPLLQQKINLSQWRKTLPERFSSQEMRLPMTIAQQEKIIKDCRQWALCQKSDLLDMDGLRAKDSDGWWIVRSSQTEPLLVVRFEGKNLTYYNKTKQTLSEIFLKNNFKDRTFANLC
ncbi:MAG: phosphomannomutase/phosphoglucomutase [Holosporaceae bacterium]